MKGDRVKVSLVGHSLVHCELSVETWGLLWELRTSIQTMLYRNLNNPDNAITNSAQDGKLISLLVELLNNTDSNPFIQNQDSDSEVDWWHRAPSACVLWICWLAQRNQRGWRYLICTGFCFFENLWLLEIILNVPSQSGLLKSWDARWTAVSYCYCSHKWWTLRGERKSIGLDFGL